MTMNRNKWIALAGTVAVGLASGLLQSHLGPAVDSACTTALQVLAALGFTVAPSLVVHGGVAAQPKDGE